MYKDTKIFKEKKTKITLRIDSYNSRAAVGWKCLSLLLYFLWVTNKMHVSQLEKNIAKLM